MSKLPIPKEYVVDGLETLSYDKINKRVEAVKYKTPNGTTFTLASDVMGIQFCSKGRLWPNKRSWKSMEEGVAYLRENTAKAIAFFESAGDKSTTSFDVGDVLFTIAVKSVRKGGA